MQFLNYYSSPVLAVWESVATYYTTSNNACQVFVHEDQSILLSNGEFFTHFGHTIKKFTAQTIPPLIRNGTFLYSPGEYVKMCVEIQTLPTYHKQQVNEPEDQEIFLDGIKVENQVEGLATFTAYNDRSVRVLFDDRTVIRIYPDMRVTAINRSGEVAKLNLDSPIGFEEYIPVCVEFYT